MSENKGIKKEVLGELEQTDRILSEVFVRGEGVTAMAQARLLLKKIYEDVKRMEEKT